MRDLYCDRSTSIAARSTSATPEASILRTPPHIAMRDSNPMNSTYRFFTAQTIATYRAAAACIVPSDDRSQGAESEAALGLADAALADRPVRDQRLLGTFLRALEFLPVLRYGRRFLKLAPAQRTRFLASLENSRVAKLRQGFFGVKTFALMGYYGHPSTWAELGYPGPRLDAPYYQKERQ